MFKKALFIGLALVFPGVAQSALVFTIDTYTISELTFTLSGTFDDDTIGNEQGWLAIKNDWSSNTGTHTDFLGLGATMVSNIMIGGFTPLGTIITTGDIDTFSDSIAFLQQGGSFSTIVAGTTVSGSATLSAIVGGAFNPTDASTLELVSGFNYGPSSPLVGGDWARLEATATFVGSVVPVPAAVWLFGTALLGFVGMARKTKVT